MLEQELLYQRYIGLHERSKLSQILSCRSLWSWYKLRIISLLVHNSQNYQNHKSLELGIVVKRIVLAFFCFVFALLLLFTYCLERWLSICILFCCKSMLVDWGGLKKETPKSRPSLMLVDWGGKIEAKQYKWMPAL